MRRFSLRAAMVVIALSAAGTALLWPREARLPPIEPGARRLFPVNPDGRWGYIDREGRMVIAPSFHSAGRFVDGVAPVRIDRHMGYIDEAGNVVIECRFEWAMPFWNGRGRVKLDGAWQIVSRDGALAPCPDDMARAWPGDDTSAEDREGLIAFEERWRWGFRDANGRVRIAPRYEHVYRFDGGLCRVGLDGELVYIDRAGREVWRPRYPLDVSTMPWDFSGERASVSHSVERVREPWAATVTPEDGFAPRTIRFVIGGRTRFEFEGHSATVFRIVGEVLILADFHPQSLGCAMLAVDLASGARRWRTQLKGPGAIDHSLYSNRVNLEVQAGRIVVMGAEWRNYIEVLDFETGRILAHRIVAE